MYMFATIAAVAMLSVASPRAQEDAVMKAFEHYEGMRVALSADAFNDVAHHATALAPLVEAVGGAASKTALEGVRRATDIKQAREHFGALSAALIPAFEKRALDDVYFYRCSMVNQSWAQRGKPVQNPYMGKAMASCGSPLKSAK
ncbi:hypothetical protein BH18ACI5_BH18ACI5_09020 [soil metagenome]